MSLFSTSSTNHPADQSAAPGDNRLHHGRGAEPPLFEDNNALPGFAQVPSRRPEKAAAPVVAPTPQVAEQLGVALCPRCQGKLIDPQGMGWCRACGYCKSIEDDKGLAAVQKPAARQPSALGVVDFFFLLTKIPDWVYLMILGSGGVFAASLMPGRLLAVGLLERAVWSTTQIGVGLALIFVAQLMLLFALAPLDEKLSFKDAVLPFRLWGLAFQRGGRFKVPFWLATWGVSAIVAAVFVVGGLDYWERYLPRSQPATPPPAPVKKR